MVDASLDERVTILEENAGVTQNGERIISDSHATEHWFTNPDSV